nr:nucleoside hydrolase [Kineosporia babensis]
MDVDTGIDDAMAIMFAVRHPGIDVRAISCVAGNASLERVVTNTLGVLELLDAPPIPVAGGAQQPLIEPSRPASWVHGADGLAGLDLPVGGRKPVQQHAVELMRQTLMAAAEPLTVVCLAPMTNLALLLRTHPEVIERIERVVFMGGAVADGNATALAEFNVWHDPEAAYVVLNSGVPLTMYGLDVFHTVEASAETTADLKASGQRLDQVLGALLGYEMVNPLTGAITVNRVIGDAGAVCAITSPELFRFETWPLQVELAPGLSRGQTVVDRRRAIGEDTFYPTGQRPWPTADIALSADPEAVLQLFFDTVR